MDWVELAVPCAALADEVAALLCEMGAAAGAEVRDGEIIAWAPAAEAEAARAALDAAAGKLAAAGFAVGAVRVRPAAPEHEWRDAWKQHFRVARVGERIVIVPSWERHVARPGDVVLDLDPGRAFGTGTHASTRLCLQLLEAHEARVERFLDVGTGSGILAIAAAKLWPEATGVAVDVDPEAVGAAAENLERNGVTRVHVSERPLAEVEGRFDLVLANIQADILEAMAPDLAARAAGRLVLSGLLAEQLEPIVEVYRRLGFAVVGTRMLEEWGAAVLAPS